MLNKLIKNIHWKIKTQKFKKCGVDNRIGIDFSIHGEEYISMGSHFRGGRHVIIDAIDNYNGDGTGYLPCIEIGDNVTLTDYCYISCINKIRIENGVLLGTNTFITDNYHGENKKYELDIPPSKRKIFSKGEVLIEKNVWIGRNVCILPGVRIGAGSVIGANSVVTHDVDCNSIYAGVPAHKIRDIDGWENKN
jgi:carbonic anhydrase/acetyltransferase-like protein (isoleucine patch superfamily)